LFRRFSQKYWYGWCLTACARWVTVDIMGWKKADFETRAPHRTILRRGYVRGVFGVAKDHGDWLIFHLPTGMMFLYSAWPTLTEAKRFADALLEREAWNDPKLAEHPHRFNMICDEIADVLGEPRRTMRRIC